MYIKISSRNPNFDEVVMDIQIILLMLVKLMGAAQTQGRRLPVLRLTPSGAEKCLKSGVSHHSVTLDIAPFEHSQHFGQHQVGGSENNLILVYFL